MIGETKARHRPTGVQARGQACHAAHMLGFTPTIPTLPLIQPTGTFFCVTTTTESAPLTEMLVKLTDLAALKAYSVMRGDP